MTTTTTTNIKGLLLPLTYATDLDETKCSGAIINYYYFWQTPILSPSFSLRFVHMIYSFRLSAQEISKRWSTERSQAEFEELEGIRNNRSI